MSKKNSLILCLLLSFAVATGAPEIKRPRLLGVAHMALFVSDIEKSRAFYKDFLGFAEPFDLKNADGSLSLTFIKVNDRQYIELFPRLKPEQDRLNHISFYTDDAERLRAYLGERGVTVPAKANRVRIGNTSFNVTDPEGHKVEFTQYEPTGWSMRERGKFIGAQRISARILHLGVIVGDAPAAMKFYTDKLGFKEFWRGQARNSDTLSWINMRLPDGDDYLEFMLYAEQPAPDKRGSQHHICLEVPDVEKAAALLEARPYRKNYTRPLEVRVGVNRRRQLNLFDPDGTRLELMEPKTVDGQPAPVSAAPLPVRK